MREGKLWIQVYCQLRDNATRGTGSRMPSSQVRDEANQSASCSTEAFHTNEKKIPSAHVLGKFQIKPPYSIAMLNTYSVETTAVPCPWSNRKSVKIKQFFCTLYSFAMGLRIRLPRRCLRNESCYLDFNCYECFWSKSNPLFNKHGYCPATLTH